MRFIIAPDAFKGSLSAVAAAEAIAAGIHDAMPDAETETLPLADGGEGTLDVLAPHVAHGQGRVSGGEYLAYIENGKETALIESARCLGLMLPSMAQTDVFQRGSAALGGAMRTCLDACIRRLVVALGGSASNDAGLGLLMALGLQAMDVQGRTVSPDLLGLTRVATLDASGLDARLADCDLTVLCDVDAPLCGPRGATLTYGPQKGLAADALAGVDTAVARFAALAEAGFHVPAGEAPGSGAAGGLGFALALLGGRLVSGAAYVIEKSGLSERLKGADWVVTGEGRSDAQTLRGKLPLKIAESARAAGKKVTLISGDLVDAPMLAGAFDAVVPARPQNMAVETAMEQAASLLRRAACVWAKTVCRN